MTRTLRVTARVARQLIHDRRLGGVATLPFTDLDGASYQVHFDDFEEQVRNPRTQLTTPSYHCPIVLVEA